MCKAFPFLLRLETTVTLQYELQAAKFVRIDIFNSNGKKVSSLANELQVEGEHSVVFNDGSFAPGMYYYKMHIGNQLNTGELLLAR